MSSRIQRSLAVALFLSGGCFVEVGEPFYANGQIVVVRGASGLHGERQGVWVYFNADGSLKWDESIDGELYERTGVYESGRRVCKPTEQELEHARQVAREKMREFGATSGH